MKIEFIDQTKDFKSLLQVFESVFEWENYVMPSEEYSTKILQNEHFKVVGVKSENQIIGGLTGYILHGYDIPKPFFYIYDLGVAHKFQNQGVGKELINFIRKFASENDFHEIYVTTELTDNDDALNFYRKTPITDQIKVMQFSYLISN